MLKLIRMGWVLKRNTEEESKLKSLCYLLGLSAFGRFTKSQPPCPLSPLPKGGRGVVIRGTAELTGRRGLANPTGARWMEKFVGNAIQ
jgi:hypothetical protein